jgi:hypothetical protein
MNLCSKDHEEVCFEGRNCPVCDTRNELTSQIDTLKKERDTLQRDVDHYEDELANT